MTFISYAQNFEDVMLWRALKHVENGFYIDVGANDPTVDSVTMAFYERGWRGINVEPMQQYHQLLLASRPRDINLPVAVGDSTGELTFFDIPGTGLSTTDPAIARMHASAGHKVIEEHIPVTTLSEICDTYVQGPIHFLKIDVEGFEAAVLRGMDLGKWCPWILVIEATKPQTQITAHDEWEHMVLDAGYRLAYFDGLNKYYVAPEHPELLQALELPPNFFDDFKLRDGHYFSYPITDSKRSLHEAESHAIQAEVRAREAEAQFVQAEAEAFKAQAYAQQMAARAEHMENRAQQVEAQLLAVYQSTSWRITRPVRCLKPWFRQLMQVMKNLFPTSPSLRQSTKGATSRLAHSIIARPRLRQFVAHNLARFPAVDRKIRSLWARMKNETVLRTAGQTEPETEGNPQNLPASARRVLADISRVVDRNR